MIERHAELLLRPEAAANQAFNRKQVFCGFVTARRLAG